MTTISPAVEAAQATPVEASAVPVADEAAAADRLHERVRLYVWEVPVRISHWVLVGSIVVLSLTGGYIAEPFLIPPGGPVMTTVRFLHIAAAFALVASGLVRTVWLLVGNRFARWTAFIPTSSTQATEAVRQAGFYGFVRREMPKVLGHNQLAASAYIVLFLLLLIETITGLVLDGVLGAQPAGLLFGWLGEALGLQTIRSIHHLAMWAILAISLFHVYSCVLVDHIERNGLLSSMFSGYKFPTRKDVLEARDGGPELLEQVE